MTRRATRFVVHLLGTLVGIAAILLGVLTWRLSQGPIVLGNVTPYLEAALNSQDSGFRLGLDEAVLTWGDWEGALEVRGYGLSGTGSDGEVDFAAKEVVLDLALGPLLRGEVKLLAVSLIRPWIRVVRAADGTISFDIGTDQSTDDTPSITRHPDQGVLPGGDIMRALLEAKDALPALQDLNRFSVVDADLWIDDRYLDVLWNAPEADLTLTRDADAIRMFGDLVVRFSDSDVPVDLSATYRLQSGELVAQMGFAQLPIARLFDTVPGSPEINGIEAPLSGRVDMVLNGDLGLLEGRFALDVGAGRIELPDLFEFPIAFSSADIRGRLRAGFSGIEFDAFHLATEQALVTGDAVLDGFAPDSLLDLNFLIVDMPVDSVESYWPVYSAPAARQWVVDHIAGGVVNQAVFAFDWTLDDLMRGDLPLSDLVIEGDVSGATITYFADMPPAEGINAKIRLAGETVHAESQGGNLQELTLGSGIVDITALSGQTQIQIGVDFGGPVDALVELAGHPRLGFSDGVGLEPNALTGLATGRLEVLLPRLSDLSFDEIDFQLQADLAGVSLPAGIGGYDVGDGSGLLHVDNTGLDVTADLLFDGTPFAAVLHQNFSTDVLPLRSVTLTGLIDQKGIDKFDLAPLVVIEGQVGLDVAMVESWHGEVNWTIATDLTSAQVAFPMLDLDKPPGERGELAFRLIDRPVGPVVIEAARFETGDVMVAGHGELEASSLALRRMDFERLTFGRNDLVGSLAVLDDQRLDIRVDGGELDMVPFMADLGSASGPELPSFVLSGKLDRVWLTDNDSVTGVDLAADYEEDHWERLDLFAQLAGGAPMTMRIWRYDDNERRFEHTAGDAGEAMRLFDLFDDGQGGTIDIRARIDDSDPERPVNGIIRMDDVTLYRTPILARLLSLASLTSIANAVTGEGKVFDAAVVPFEKRSDLVTITDARAYGPGIGITVEGTIDLTAAMLNLNGTMVPAYLVNSILGDIPVVGDILTGGDEGGGIFAVTYQINGPYSDPEVGVDPLSVLAPGYLRSLFSAPNDDEINDFNFGDAGRDR